MARSPVLCLHMVLFLFVSAPAPARAAPGAANAPTTSDAACITPSGIDAHCYGAAGNGSTDDTAALDRAVSAALATDQPLFLPHGTYMLSRPVVIDYRTRSDTGFRVVSMGAILDGKTIARQPVLEIECSGGTAISPKGCFYFNEQGTLFVNARSDSYAVVIGQGDFSDAQNSIKIDHLIVNNAGAGARSGGLQLNYVLNAEIFAVADSAGGAAGIALEQTQISRISGAGSAATKGGAALRIENGYSFANTIDAMDLEVAPTCLVIDSRNAAHNTFISPYMACPTAVDASAGNTTRLVNPLFAGNVKKEFAAAVGVATGP
jgi:Pectate lyase superfamily protein